MANGGSDRRGSGARTADAGYNGGLVMQGTATAVAGARMRRATAEQMHWWLSRGVRAAGANRAQWLERLSYCGSEQAAGTALVVARVTAAAEAGSSGGSGDSGLRWEGECEVI